MIAGSNGEAVTLSTTEKTTLVQLARKTATQLNRPDITLTLGCSGQATRHVLDECHAAAHPSTGVDFVLILVPSYYSSAMDAQSIVDFFKEVADESPLPVMVYNFPSVAGGLDVDSEMLVELSKHANISGVKLTCGSIGKVPRVVGATATKEDDGFAVFSGQIDWMGPAMGVGAVGAITGMANLHPRVSSLPFFSLPFPCFQVMLFLTSTMYSPASNSTTSTSQTKPKKQLPSSCKSPLANGLSRRAVSTGANGWLRNCWDIQKLAVRVDGRILFLQTRRNGIGLLKGRVCCRVLRLSWLGVCDFVCYCFFIDYATTRV